ncbi:putative flagellar associated protein [Spironucleus salmonicida]|uniref:Flagellar associated protein n=1 Tax=Spironucleus salmonicida TaxID=348837 RepID=V6LVE9_9EUKA|nr:putative flagellar associated protein [Spironucleus salmonicida]|eukprot:EST48208.1 Putative flagellar associated protein [Spironucleus salmonicida]
MEKLQPSSNKKDQPSIQKVLQDIWRPLEVDLPLFADDSNTALYDNLKTKSTKISTLLDTLIKLESYVITIENHQHDVTSELKNAQSLLDGRKRETDAEEHMIKLIERDIGRMKEKTKQFETRHIELEDRRQSQQTNLLKQHAKLAELGRENQWLLDEQQEWKLAQEQKADDSFALEKYKAIDDKQLQELLKQIKRQETIVNSLQNQLDNETQETQNAQLALNKSAFQFKKLQEDRELLTNNYQSALEQLEGIEKYSDNTQQLLQQRKFEVEDLKAQDRQLSAEIEGYNKESVNADHELEAIERECQLSQEQVNILLKNLANLEGEVLVVKGALNNTEKTITRQTTIRNELSNALNARKANLLEIIQRNDILSQVQDIMDNKNMDLNERTQATIQLVEDVKSDHAYNKRLLEAEQLKLQHAGKRLFDLKDQESTLKSNISSYQAGLKGLESRILNMENQLQQQRRHIYNADFQIQALTRKLSHVRGDISAEEQLVLKKNIDGLQYQLEKENQGIKLVKQQTGSVLAEIGRVKRQLTEVQTQKSRVLNQLNELVLSSQTQTISVQKTTEERQESLLLMDQLKITRERILQNLTEKTAISFGLENRSEQLQISSNLKIQQLYAARSILQNELRLLQNDLHTTKMELKSRKIATSKLEARCFVVSRRVAALAAQAQNSTEEVDPKTAQAEAIIGFGKRRADLFQQKEVFQQQRKKLESEVNGLAQALDALRSSNSNIRQLGRPASAAGGERLKAAKNELAGVESEVLYCITSNRKVIKEIDEIQRINEELKAQVDEIAERLNGDY